MLLVDELANIVYLRPHLLEGLLLITLTIFKLLGFPRLIIDNFGEHFCFSDLELILFKKLLMMLLHLEKEFARQLHLVVIFALRRLIYLNLESKLFSERI